MLKVRLKKESITILSPADLIDRRLKVKWYIWNVTCNELDKNDQIFVIVLYLTKDFSLISFRFISDNFVTKVLQFSTSTE